MNTLLSTILVAASVLLAMPVAVLTVETCLALTYRRKNIVTGPRPALAVLVPAHDEAAGIGRTLASLAPQLVSGDRLVVIADNCSDDTAPVAEAAGATVIQRRDPSRRGKGFALDFGVRHLSAAAPEVVIIVDADCEVAAGTIDNIARLCGAIGRPVQGLYLMRSPSDATLSTRIAEFAWTVKNQVRPTGLRQLGLPCQLMGTGMAFPWPTLRDAHLASDNIVEDLKLGLDLACTGQAPVFSPDALVSSMFPASVAGLQTQRTRWEHGHLGLILSSALPILLLSLRRRDAGLVALGLDLMVPPLALLLLLCTSCFAADAIFALLTGRLAPLCISTTSGLLLGCAVFLSWFRWGREIVSAGQLARAPLYALRKVPLYLGFMRKRQTDWVRSQRDR